VSPLCSRNARPKKALVGRAQWGAHPILETRYMSKLGRIIVGCSLRPCWTGFLSILRSVFLLSKGTDHLKSGVPTEFCVAC
jgi:hypothetical protein